MRRIVFAALLTFAFSDLVGAQGIQPMTPQLWERARQDGMRGEVPANSPLLTKIDEAKAAGSNTAALRLLQRMQADPFTFRVISPYVQAAEAARDPATAAKMAQGVVSPETMVI